MCGHFVNGLIKSRPENLYLNTHLALLGCMLLVGEYHIPVHQSSFSTHPWILPWPAERSSCQNLVSSTGLFFWLFTTTVRIGRFLSFPGLPCIPWSCLSYTFPPTFFLHNDHSSRVLCPRTFWYIPLNPHHFFTWLLAGLQALLFLPRGSI